MDFRSAIKLKIGPLNGLMSKSSQNVSATATAALAGKVVATCRMVLIA